MLERGNILVLNPTHGHSHVHFVGSIADMLANDGHNVTVLSPIWDESVAAHGTSNPKVNKIKYTSSDLTKFLGSLDMKKPSFWDLPEHKERTIRLEEMKGFQEAFELQYKGMIGDTELMQQLHASKFDLAVVEYFELGALGFFELFGIKSTISVASLGIHAIHYKIIGMPYFTSFIPEYITIYGPEMTFWERFRNWKTNRDFENYHKPYIARLETIFRQCKPDMLDLEELAVERTGLILSNVNEFTESPKPRTNMIQYIGGINVHAPKPLEPEIASLLELRPSAVFFSFGTYLKSCQMPERLKLELLEAFASFPDVTFLWKYEEQEDDTTPFEKYPNVVPKPWWPQSDLLGDDRVKAFITHGGMNSMLEVSYRGKPTISVPLFGDQYVNVKAAVCYGLSTMIKRTELSKKAMVEALHKVLDKDSQIARTAKMAASILEGKGDEYREEALRRVKLLLQYGPMKHHRLPTRHLNFFQFCGLDIYLYLLSIPVLSLLVLFILYKIAHLAF